MEEQNQQLNMKQFTELVYNLFRLEEFYSVFKAYFILRNTSI